MREFPTSTSSFEKLPVRAVSRSPRLGAEARSGFSAGTVVDAFLLLTPLTTKPPLAKKNGMKMRHRFSSRDPLKSAANRYSRAK